MHNPRDSHLAVRDRVDWRSAKAEGEIEFVLGLYFLAAGS